MPSLSNSRLGIAQLGGEVVMDMTTRPAAIIGDSGDPHVQAIADRIAPDRPVVILDAASLEHVSFALYPDSISVESANGHGRVRLDCAHRGWVRRLSPEGWDHGVALGSKDAAVKAAWLALLVSFIRNPACKWLTNVDAFVSAENKIVQYRAARHARVRIPRTIVTNDAREAALLSGELIAKALGPQNFHVDTGDKHKLFAQTVDVREPRVAELVRAAPIILQERLSARSHFRVVTVCDRAWSFSIPANGLPVDWRQNVAAHSSWDYTKRPDIEEQAIALSAVLSVGYSSQDWIETKDGTFFIDLNPGGQWLFLPEPVASEISLAIARWLGDAD